MSLLDFLGFKPTLPKFARKLVQAMPPEQRPEWVFDAEQGTLRHPGGMEMSLHNMFMEYCASGGSARAELLAKYASLASAQASEIPDLWIGAAKNIYPVIRSEYVDTTVEIKQRLDGGAREAVVFPFVGDLRVRLMYDFGSYLAYINADKLAAWGQPAGDVLARAIANLGRLEAPTWHDKGHGVFQLESPDSFAESMLLLDSVVAKLPFGPHAMLTPCNRGVLLAADGRSDAAVGAMLALAEQHLAESPWALSSVLCARDGSGWKQVEAPASQANLAHGLAIRHAGENYFAQKGALDALNEAQDNDVYVAEYTVIQAGAKWQSYCVWARSVRTLLPVTDWVALIPDAEQSTFVRIAWKDLAEICRDRLQPTQEKPARFLVDSFPDEQEWARLEARALGELG